MGVSDTFIMNKIEIPDQWRVKYPHIVTLRERFRPEKRDDSPMKWIYSNLENHTWAWRSVKEAGADFSDSCYCFMNEQDAIMFTLRWS